MAQECNNQEAREAYSTKGNSFKVPVTSVSIISKIIKLLINLPNTPKPKIPRSLILIGSTFRPGINSASMTARLLQKKQQYGLPTSPLPSGGENLANIETKLMMESVHDELVENAKIVGTNDNIAKGFVTTPSGVFPVFFKPGSISVIANIT